MSLKHGVYFTETPTTLQTMAQVESGIIVAVGTAFSSNTKKAELCYKYSEFTNIFGTDDNYTLPSVADIVFNIYNVAPAIFINALDFSKHYNEVTKNFGGVSSNAVTFRADIDTSTLKVTSGVYEAPNILEKDIDFEITDDEVEDLDEDTIDVQRTLHILNRDNIVDDKIVLKYQTAATEISTEITLTGDIYVLPSDTVTESVVIESGGVNTLRSLTLGLDYNFKYDSGNATINIISENIVDDSIDVSYHEIDPSKVTPEDIVAAVEVMDSIQPRFNLAGNFSLIAPGYSTNGNVAAALATKAHGLNGIFPSIAVADLEADSYTEAVTKKNTGNLSDAHLIICYPCVKVNEKVQYLSTHIAALMNQVDNAHDEIPYASPSNHTLQIDAACDSLGNEIYLSQDQANLLNSAGIVTVLSLYGLKAWGNYTSAYPSTSDIKDYFISVRRMVNFIIAEFIRSYISELDVPINRRTIESILQSANIYLAALVAKGALLGGRLEFNEDDNATNELMAGNLHFRLYVTPPSPAQSLTFELEIDTGYYSALFVD